MATLFERLVGINTDATDDKMAIHSFCGALNELRRGKLTGGEIASMFGLDAAQQTDAVALKDLLVAAPDRIEFMRVLKDWLYLGEDDREPRYRVQATFVARLQTEVTDQGGTLP
jgi:hypothetical protein